ncbi:MAG: RNA polymerase sigma-70 factor [Flavobacteriales bacterium]|nr:MAG: RNA polymerase sigma-70 factor [Flavobacteriales bacterium]
MQLVTSVNTDQRSTFDKIYQEYHSQIYGYILQRSKSSYIAQEVTQLTFIKLWDKYESLDQEVAINIQLFGMARQVMIDLLRKESVRFKYEGQVADTPFTDSLIDAIESKELLRLMEQDIQQMPKMRRMIFELSRKNGLSHKEIAEMFDISPKTVEHHIGKALLQLKQHLYSIML